MKKIIASILVIALITTASTIAIGASENTTENTTVHYVNGNSPPNKPDTPGGETSGKPGYVYDYTTKTTDPDDDDVQYGWNWTGGDVEELTVDNWTGFSPSGQGILTSHVWDEKGNYEIRVKARDIHGAEGDWSDPLTMNITKSVQSSQQAVVTETTSTSQTSNS